MNYDRVFHLHYDYIVFLLWKKGPATLDEEYQKFVNTLIHYGKQIETPSLLPVFFNKLPCFHR